MKLRPLYLFLLSFLLVLPGCHSSKGDDPVEPDVPTSYEVRNENYLNFYIDIQGEKAQYYYYFAYLDESFHVSVDVVDEYVFMNNPDIGYNDNIEFNIQPLTTATRYDVGDTYNIMLNLAQDRGWLRSATDKQVLGGDRLYDFVNSQKISFARTMRTVEKDGYNGVTVDLLLSYQMWDASKDDLYGKLTIEPAARNTNAGGSEFRSYVEKGCRYSYAYTAVVVNGDGSYSQNNGNLPELTPLLEEKNLLHEDKDLTNNFATIVDNSHANHFVDGAHLFTNRRYFLWEGIAPRELVGKTYYYDTIEASKSITIKDAGYVVVIVPTTGYDNLNSYVRTAGFSLINDDPAKQIGTNSCGVIGLNEESNYYIKWCEPGETFVLQKWCLILTKELETYPKITKWETELGQVHKMSSEEALSEYAPSDRLWEGIPGIEWVKRDDGGSRLWASFFSGGTKEPTIYNYAVYYFSDDDGQSWTFAFVVDFPGDKEDTARIFDPSIKYHDGKLYLYWNQTGAEQYTNQVACAILENPGMAVNSMEDIEKFVVGDSFFCSRGIKMNKPIVLPSGEWLYAAHDPLAQNYVEIYSSKDDGLTWSLKGKSRVNNVTFVTESTLVYVDDIGKELVLYSRTDFSYNQAVSYSHDGGVTWTDSVDNGRICPSSRPFAYRLQSGNIAFAHHYNSYNRENMMISLSTNGCQSYDHCLILDVRNGVSYPDITQSDDGSIYVTWDYSRYGSKQILFAKLSEEELLQINGVATMDTNRIQEVCSVVTQDHTYEINGKIVDEENNPVVGANISCNGATATSNVNGQYSLKNISFSNSGSSELVISKDGFTTQRINITNDHVIDYNYHLKKDITLKNIIYGTYEGKVVDINLNPLEGVEVKIDGVSKAYTNYKGEYSIANQVIQTCDFEFVYAGYKTAKLQVLEQEETIIDVGTSTVLKTNQCDLGTVGGTHGNKYHLYSERLEDGVNFYAVGDTNLVSSQNSFEVWINVYGYSKSRSINTSYYRFLQNGSFAAFYMPNNASTSMTNVEGITNSVSGRVMKGYIPYSIMSQHLPTGITVDKNTELAINFISLSSNLKDCDFWQAENIPGINQKLSGEINKFNTKSYLTLTKDNELSTSHAEWYTMDDLKKLVEDSSVYNGVPFIKGMLAETNATTRTQTKGGVMFSDRAASVHSFDDFRLKALDGFNFVYNPVLSTVNFTVTTSGYIIVMYPPTNKTVPSGFVDIIVNYSNPGIASNPSHALFNYAVIYAEAGDTFTLDSSLIAYVK